MKRCKVADCTTKASAKGLCNLHYRRLLKGQSLTAPKRFKRAPAKCEVVDCEEMGYVGGLCKLHYNRAYRGVPLNTPKGKRHEFVRRAKRPEDGLCTLEGCDRPHVALGYCRLHYDRAKVGIPLTRPLRQTTKQPCAVKGCERKVRRNGMCAMHNARKKNGLPLEYEGRLPTTNQHPIGYRRHAGKGYWHIKTEEGWMFEHRHVMEVHLGRKLLKTERVHHKNGERGDNRLSNLELWSSDHPAGQRVEDKIQWAVDFLKFYAPSTLKEEGW